MVETPPQSASPAPSARPVKGIFSLEAARFLGRALPARAVAQRIFVFAEEREPGSVRLQRLDADFVPAGPVRLITRERLLTEFQPEPGLYLNKVAPAMHHRAVGPVLDGERGPEAMTAEHVRVTFDLGLTYLERRDRTRAEIVFRKLGHLEAAFAPEHKHLFNDFGMQMRKAGLYDEAMRYYVQAYRLCRTDDHLLYNMARTLYAKGRLVSARAMLRKALRLRGDFSEAQTFLTFLDAKLRGDTPPEPVLD